MKIEAIGEVNKLWDSWIKEEKAGIWEDCKL